ncbi:MAG: UDP-glucose/GDP-mannose dehydrogenase family protein [Anaerolineae bacterium]|nr:UDP-glucose/GDP-mannose dehydrogenase family protein [Anaerolineae bacterium]
MANICVVGVGYVGLVTGTCFADLGNKVVALDIVEKRVENLKKGILPIYEPGLKEVVERNVRAERLSFTSSYKEALKDVEFVFICVGTPEGVDGEADLQYVRMAAEAIAENMDHEMIVINKSTVPVGTGDWVASIIREKQAQDIPFAVVSCPEFLREGSALRDFFNPDRTVLGSTDKTAANKVAQLHLALRAPIVVTDLRTAEMIKYASNAFLATRISFINEIANICEALGADVKEVAQGMGYDKRIGHHFLESGVGYGGSCFPKDVKALAYMAQIHGTEPQLLQSVMEINLTQRRQIVLKLEDMLGTLKDKVIGMVGLAFKENTDDIRESPALDIAKMLHDRGAVVRGYDPVAMENVQRTTKYINLSEDPYELAQGSDALVIATPWNEFKSLDFDKIRSLMKQPIIVDGRNLYEPTRLTSLGFKYRGVGRGFKGAMLESNGK